MQDVSAMRLGRHADLLAQVRSLAPALAAAFPAVDVLYVFGSVAAGSAKPGSDVDLAVYVRDDDGSGDALLDLRLALWLQDRLGHAADVVIMNTASGAVRPSVRTPPSCVELRSAGMPSSGPARLLPGMCRTTDWLWEILPAA